MSEEQQMNKGRSELTGALIGVGVMLFYVSVFFGILLGGIAVQEHARTIRVGKAIPSTFPILVVSRAPGHKDYSARIVYQWALQDYLRKTPGWSFTVPEGKDEYLNAQLAAQTEAIWHAWGNGCPFGAGGFRVERLPDGKQRFVVDGSWDDDRVSRGWYVADARHFYPRSYLWYFGPGLCMMLAPVAIVGVCVVAVVDSTLRKRLRRRIRDARSVARAERIALIASLLSLLAVILIFCCGDRSGLRQATAYLVFGSAATARVASFWTLAQAPQEQTAPGSDEE